MYKRVVFVDFENLQKIKEEYLTADTKLVVLCGENQAKTALNLTKEHIGKPCAIEFIKPNVHGPNALDFCLVFYIGFNISAYKNSQIVIYSKNKNDYDPLIKHLKEIGIDIVRKEYEEAKEPKQVIAKQKQVTDGKNYDTAVAKAYDEVIKHFHKIKAKFPKNISKLKADIKTSLNNNSDKIADQVVELMMKREIVIKTGTEDAIKFNKDKL